nr:MAG TPA: TRYPTOPHAN RNA-BINDING ATTENUATOR PROTEIN-INHIBITORY PROTEIN REGULATION, ANTI-TRAP [Caudoviricetes sp.]
MSAYYGLYDNPYETDEYPEPYTCPDCNGSGIACPATRITPEEPCGSCDGTGACDCAYPGYCGYHDAQERPGGDCPDPWLAATPLEPPL